MNDYLNVIRNNYANFEGRARRQEYWMFQLFNFIAVSVLYGLSLLCIGLGSLGSGSNSGMNAGVIFSLIFVGLLVIYSLGVLVPTLALTVRRLHDAGQSGWMYLLSLVPLANIAVFVFTVLDSQPGINKWGPNPKGVTAIPAPF